MSKNNKIPEEVLEKEILYDENSDCVETTVDEPEDKITYGIVCRCDKLRLREEPYVDGRIISELPKHTRVIVDENITNDEWVYVETEFGSVGYCMKNYIDLNTKGDWHDR